MDSKKFSDDYAFIVQHFESPDSVVRGFDKLSVFFNKFLGKPNDVKKIMIDIMNATPVKYNIEVYRLTDDAKTAFQGGIKLLEWYIGDHIHTIETQIANPSGGGQVRRRRSKRAKSRRK
jgi:hypothetical protein